MYTLYSPDKPPVQGLPIRDWNIEVYLVNDKGENIPATIFDKVTFDLHPSFGKKAKQSKSRQ
jgi:transcription initiation factor IIF auxiliary subunit